MKSSARQAHYSTQSEGLVLWIYYRETLTFRRRFMPRKKWLRALKRIPRGRYLAPKADPWGFSEESATGIALTLPTALSE